MSSNPTIPSQMRAVVLSKTGGPEVLELKHDQPVPQPGKDQVLVKNTFAGINFIDVYFRKGVYPSPSGYPLIIGQEASGRVAALGAGDDRYGFRVGDRVVWLGQGGYAEYTAVPAEKEVKIPEGISDEDAVGGFLMGMTALSLIREAYEVKRGDWVLLHAAAGGVGLLMCQLLRKLGAKTIGTAGGPEKCALAKENGADVLIDYKSEQGPHWLETVKKVTGGAGVAVVYDSVGADTWESSLEAVRRKGTGMRACNHGLIPRFPQGLTEIPEKKVVFFGGSSGPVPPFPVQRLAAKNCAVLRPTLMNYTYTREELEYYAGELFKIVKSGELQIRKHKTYDLADADQAHRDLEGRKTAGKCLLKC